jgi:hypothetical protein
MVIDWHSIAGNFFKCSKKYRLPQWKLFVILILILKYGVDVGIINKAKQIEDQISMLNRTRK